MKYWIQVKKNGKNITVIGANGKDKEFRTLISARKGLIQIMEEKSAKEGTIYYSRNVKMGKILREDDWSNVWWYYNITWGESRPIYKNGKIKPGMKMKGKIKW